MSSPYASPFGGKSQVDYSIAKNWRSASAWQKNELWLPFSFTFAYLDSVTIQSFIETFLESRNALVEINHGWWIKSFINWDTFSAPTAGSEWGLCVAKCIKNPESLAKDKCLSIGLQSLCTNRIIKELLSGRAEGSKAIPKLRKRETLS